MRVRTLTGKDFSCACETLARKVLQNYRPDIIVGILTGGGIVGKEVLETINSDTEYNQAIYTEIRIQRPGTKKKGSGWKKVVLQHLPVIILNWLRMAEALFVEYKAYKRSPLREGNIVFEAKVDRLLRHGNKKVLLVDDAIDTGATLSLVKSYIMEHYKEIEVRIAVITITMPHPRVEADYYLFHNRTLIRFPWSNDIKK